MGVLSLNEMQAATEKNDILKFYIDVRYIKKKKYSIWSSFSILLLHIPNVVQSNWPFFYILLNGIV